MKKKLFTIILFTSIFGFSQTKNNYFQADYFYGNVIGASPDTQILLQGHPTGFFASYNIKTSGLKEWIKRYNYPDFGVSIGYLDYKSTILGKLYAVYGHYNFYLLNRTSINQLILRTGIGLAYSTNPYDKETNNKNTALGTTLNSSTCVKLYYQREYLFDNFGVTAGLTFVHASNSNVKSPNSGVNIWAVTAGLNYNLLPKEKNIVRSPSSKIKKFTEPIKLNLVIRGGVNESPIIGTGIKPFFVASAYLDKRINLKSALQIGADLYISPMLKDFYEINITNPYNHSTTETNSFSRIGVFIGHELFINKLSVEAQLGYYVKYPIPFDGKIYESLALKWYFTKKWFATTRLKAHLVNAETVEFGIGIRL